jgi:hypothetical protein
MQDRSLSQSSYSSSRVTTAPSSVEINFAQGPEDGAWSRLAIAVQGGWLSSKIAARHEAISDPRKFVAPSNKEDRVKATIPLITRCFDSTLRCSSADRGRSIYSTGFTAILGTEMNV